VGGCSKCATYPIPCRLHSPLKKKKEVSPRILKPACLRRASSPANRTFLHLLRERRKGEKRKEEREKRLHQVARQAPGQILAPSRLSAGEAATPSFSRAGEKKQAPQSPQAEALCGKSRPRSRKFSTI